MSCLKDAAHCMMQRTLCASTHSWKLEAELYRCHMNTVQIVVIMPKCAACLACLVCLAWLAFHSLSVSPVSRRRQLDNKSCCKGSMHQAPRGTQELVPTAVDRACATTPHTTPGESRPHWSLVLHLAAFRLVPWPVPLANQSYQVHCGSGCCRTPTHLVSVYSSCEQLIVGCKQVGTHQHRCAESNPYSG